MRHSALRRAAPQASVAPIDINILPERYRPRRISWRATRPWFLAMAFLVLLFPSARIFMRSTQREEAAVTRLSDIRTALRAYRPLAEEKSALETQIEETDRQAAEIEAAHSTVAIRAHSWSDLLQELIDLAPAGVQLTRMDQSGGEITIVGLAADHQLPVSFSDALTSSGSFESVTITSIARRSLAQPPQDQPAPAPEVFEFEMTLGAHRQEGSK